jgi:hypothetical protein
MALIQHIGPFAQSTHATSRNALTFLCFLFPIVYGHSLGTAVSTEAVATLCESGNPPSALILESPFNNIHEEIRIHPMSFLWRKMPWFKWFFTGTLTKNDVGFVSDERIGQIYIPILIMHAKVWFY